MMKWINMPRRSGKTTMLIHASFVTGIPILVHNEARRKCLLETAKKIGCEVEVITLADWYSYKHGHEDRCMIDEGQEIFEMIVSQYLNTNVVATTFTIPMGELKNENTNCDTVNGYDAGRDSCEFDTPFTDGK